MDLSRYVLGVARLMVKETAREQRKRGPMPLQLPATPTREDDEALAALEQCLGRLEPDDRRLVLSYYEGELRARIENRERLARECNLTLNALRNRVLRLREKLERCVRHRLKNLQDGFRGPRT